MREIDPKERVAHAHAHGYVDVNVEEDADEDGMDDDELP